MRAAIISYKYINPQKRTLNICLATVLSFSNMELLSAQGGLNASEGIVITSYHDFVLFPDQADKTDWQPAFQAAIEAALTQSKPLYVPEGTYPLQTSIIVPVPKHEDDVREKRKRGLQILGVGKYKSIIRQNNSFENVLMWSGSPSTRSQTFGEIRDVSIVGGKNGIEMIQHNNFQIENCYIANSTEYGLLIQGYSGRIINTAVRRCGKAGIRGSNHFNNVVIRECYFSRNPIAVDLGSGAHGVRIIGCGFERNNTAIFTHGIRSVSISESYFEGNGFNSDKRIAGSYQNMYHTLVLDLGSNSIDIHSNIFRSNITDTGALIAIADCHYGHVYDNHFMNSANAIMLLAKSNVKDQHFDVNDLIVEHNHYEKIQLILTQEAPGLESKMLRSSIARD